MPTSRYSAASEGSTLQPSGPDSGQLPLLSETNTASESSQSIGRECRSSGMLRKLLPTPHGMCADNPRRAGPTGNELGFAATRLEFCPVGSLANLIPLQANVRRLLTSVICGQSAPGLQQSFDLGGPSLKTCRDFLHRSGAHSSPAFSVTWPRWGIAWDGGYGELTMLEPFTDAIGCSSWPTPDTGQRGGPQHPEKRKDGGHSVTLQDAVRGKMWPTPTGRDHKDTGDCANVPVNGLLGRAIGPSKEFGALSPLWVEWLQGFPPEWTVCEPSATPSSRSKPIRSSKQSRKSRG